MRHGTQNWGAVQQAHEAHVAEQDLRSPLPTGAQFRAPQPPVEGSEAPITGQKAAALAQRYRGARNMINMSKALEDLSRMPEKSPERKQLALWLNSLKMVQQSQGK